MSDPGPAQLDLIRRYARTLREMHADAMAARAPRLGPRVTRERAPSEPIRQVAKSMTRRSSGARAERGAPTLPVS